MSRMPENSGLSNGPAVEVNLGALCDNHAVLAELAPSAEIGAVVKCDGYGLGAGAIARALAERRGCKTFFVIYPEEGAALRTALIGQAGRIYVFNGQSAETAPLFERYALTPVLNSIEQAARWAARAPHTPAAVHIDTGMNRLGAPQGDAAAIAAIRNLHVDMVVSHLACSSTIGHPLNAEQRARFECAAAHFSGARRSLSASAGVFLGKDYHYDLIRPGIALYGGSPMDADEARIKSAARLIAPVIQLREISAGESVGYGATFTAAAPARIATVALGYGDGVLRSAAGRGYAILNGAPAPIAGRVSMDLITLDVTGHENPPKIGDLAEFYGPSLSLHKAATNAGTAPYELLTGLGARVDRRYL